MISLMFRDSGEKQFGDLQASWGRPIETERAGNVKLSGRVPEQKVLHVKKEYRG